VPLRGRTDVQQNIFSGKGVVNFVDSEGVFIFDFPVAFEM